MPPSMAVIMCACIMTIISLLVSSATGSFPFGAAVGLIVGLAMLALGMRTGFIQLPIEDKPSAAPQPDTASTTHHRTVYDTLCGPEGG